MTRKTVVRAVGAGIAVLGVVVGIVLPAAASTTIPLTLQSGPAFGILGYSCGGIAEQVYGTGFDANGFPTGDVYLSTSCSSGGRGSHPSLHTAWGSVTWDLTGALVTDAVLSSAPPVNATGTFTDPGTGNTVTNAANKASLTWGPGFVPKPRVTGLSTSGGPTSGLTSVTITGTGFTGATSVSFNTTAAASFTFVSDTSITAVSPSVSTGETVDVIVSTPGGPSLPSTADKFRFYAVPVVDSLNPPSGPLTPSTVVTILGQNFTSASSVMFGDTPCGFFVVDDSTITAYAPLGEAVDTVGVVVTTIGGTSAPVVFTYTAPIVNTPGAPTIGSATGGDTTATVSFAIPTSDGGSPIISYTATAVDSTNPGNGGQSASAATSPITVTGLTDGDSYTFTVIASNVNGSGPASAASNAVVPTAPPPPGFSIATTTLRAAVRGAAYSVQLQSTGGTGPIKWRLIGILPKGLKLHSTGLLSGTPRVADTPGTIQLTVQATTKKSKGAPAQTATQPLTLSLS